jgi:hypothetical protein
MSKRCSSADQETYAPPFIVLNARTRGLTDLEAAARLSIIQETPAGRTIFLAVVLWSAVIARFRCLV